VIDGYDWAALEKLDGGTIWELKRKMRADLVAMARRRLAESSAHRGLAAEWTNTVLDADIVTFGFARRVPSYKRLTLMLRDPARLKALLTDEQRPIQIVIAGKSPPADEGGKALIQKVVAFARSDAASGRVVFLPDYEMTLARHLVQGVDVWLNNPRRPHEASGTSGMKAALNGVVNCSVLDGWWCEGYSPEVGFQIGGDEVAETDEAQDAADADALFAVLEQQLVPVYYDDRTRWIGLMRNSIAQLGARFNTNRMLVEYVEQLYLPAHRDLLAQLQTA
jgi:starch phosphorylase